MGNLWTFVAGLFTVVVAVAAWRLRDLTDALSDFSPTVDLPNLPDASDLFWSPNPGEIEADRLGFTLPDVNYETIPDWGDGRPISDAVRGTLADDVLLWEAPIRAAGDEFDVPTDLLAVVMDEESAGQADATGDGGTSQGLMQIQGPTQDTINEWAGTDLDRFNPLENIYLGAANLRRLKEEFSGFNNISTWLDPLRAYQCGLQGAVDNPDCARESALARLERASL